MFSVTAEPQLKELAACQLQSGASLLSVLLDLPYANMSDAKTRFACHWVCCKQAPIQQLKCTTMSISFKERV